MAALVMFGQLTYLVLLSAWALPVLLLQWAFGWRDLWRARRAWFLATTLPTLYLCLADRFALGDGIWHIHEDRSTGITLGGLPLEEALFFLVTNLMVVQTLIFLQSAQTRRRVARWRRRPAHGAVPPLADQDATSLTTLPTSTLTKEQSGAAAAERDATAERGKARRSALAAGHRRGTLGAAAGCLLSSIVAAALTSPSVLEPVAQVVMQGTPVAVANVLLQRLDPMLARSLAVFGALALVLVAGGLLGAVAALGSRPRAVFWPGVAVVGVAGLTLAFAREAAPWPALAYGIGQALFLLPSRRDVPDTRAVTEPDAGVGTAADTRRILLRHNLWVVGGVAGTLGVAAVDAARRDRLPGLAGRQLFPFQAPPARAPGFPVDGQAPEVTPVASFYVVSKNAQDPAVDADSWRLQVGGLAQRPLTLAFDDLLTLPRREEYVTFQCVSNPVGGSLMSSAYWSGASLRDLLLRVGPLPDAARVVFRAPDGHEESVPLDVALRPENMVAYAMNGELLTRLHGHPARALLPGLYGFKQVKWLTQITLAPASHRGYWPRRGWTDEATIRTTARIDLARREGDRILMAGMALAGRRGISAVEVRLAAGGDAGVPGAPAPGAPTWVPAEVHLPALAAATWVQWRALIPPSPGAGTSAAGRPGAGGELVVEVRAVDGEGRPQETAASGPFPNGAAGYHTLSLDFAGPRGVALKARTALPGTRKAD
ncbi:MAG: lycopene cyclase domain-containing protein [Chloroflexota bacterium]|nr:lycopene cyclase domain-containing protein [Chloroflexota bacterium]